ncbi:DMT family transporter [Aeromonas caviae]|uniref:DMT family transporter n=1 Tax=Aeromonas caviae TaxID=648 RepID=UPI003F7AB537
MTLLILLGLLNGVAVSLSRTLNGRLASARGAMTASLANHLLGFGLLGALLILKGAPWERLAGLDPWLLLGGVLGALFVAISSWAIGRIGALACALLIVTGQLAGGPCSMPWPDGWPRAICSASCWCWRGLRCNAGRAASRVPEGE